MRSLLVTEIPRNFPSTPTAWAAVIVRSAARGAMALILGLAAKMPASAATLAGSEWRPWVIGETRVPQDSEIFLRFEAAGRLEGHGGCSRFFGHYRAVDGALIVDKIRRAQKICDQVVAARESTLLSALASVTRYRRERTRLTLLDDSGAVLVRLVQTDWD